MIGKASKDYLRLQGNSNKLAAQALAEAASASKAGTNYGAGLCLKTVRGFYGVDSKYATAYDAWLANVKPVDRTHTFYNPPAGVPVFWRGGSTGAGHIAISDGHGNVWSTDIRRAGRVDLVPISEIRSRWGLTYLGWADTVNGVRVFD